MSLLIQCACGKKLKVREEYAGKKVKCPTCGQTLIAPTPEAEEPIDLLEMIEEDKPPTKPAKSGAIASSNGVQKPPAAWDRKKKPATNSTDKADEKDDEDEDKPTVYWVFQGTLSNEVMAMAHEGIYFVNLKGDALKRAEKLMKNGSHAAQALGEKAIYVPWDWILSIYGNKRLRGFTIHYNNGQEAVSKVLTPADHETRDAIFDGLTEFLAPNWEMTTNPLTPLSATLVPLGCIALDFVLTAALACGAYFLADEPGWEGRGRGAALAALLNLLGWMGPIWTGVVGLIIATMLGIWLLVRVMFPPIELSIHRRPAGAVDEE